jgi:CRISPR type III-A-associated protein Csm2
VQSPRPNNPQRINITPPTSSPTKGDYLKTGYFDVNGNLRSELITSTAQQIAREMGDANITYSQLRSFFTQIRAIERKLESKQFPEVVPRIQRLEYLVANYVGRGQNDFDRQNREILKRFIDYNTKNAEKDKHSFKDGFIPHFEAVIAYYKYQFPRK